MPATLARQRGSSASGWSGTTAVNSTVSPTVGMWPSSCSTRPPIVSYSPSGAR
ncbi:Uncharacterised protein [Mycobacteroides abscessus subsp. abscessus]|nr:Uncharacterised protein [Mycobacteroides abscessus subsp. abscessus]